MLRLMNIFLQWVVLKIVDIYYGFTKNIKIILFLMTLIRKILDGTPHFTLGQAIVDRRKVNEKYYS